MSLARVASAARTALARPQVSALAARPLCSMAQKGVEVDMVCRVWSCKVKDDETAHDVSLFKTARIRHARFLPTPS